MYEHVFIHICVLPQASAYTCIHTGTHSTTNTYTCARIIHTYIATCTHRAEEVFFGSRPEYRDVANQCGIANLARRLNALLVEHIRAMLPVRVCVCVCVCVWEGNFFCVFVCACARML